jgi:hypothetical protein
MNEDMRKCRLCEKIKPVDAFGKSKNYRDGIKNDCKSCCNEAVAMYRRTPEGMAKKSAYDKQYKSLHREAKNRYSYRWNDANREKKNAQASAWQAIKAGKLVRLPCWCGETKVEGHHLDYSKPLEVIWLCRKHHAGLHRSLRMLSVAA